MPGRFIQRVGYLLVLLLAWWGFSAWPAGAQQSSKPTATESTAPATSRKKPSHRQARRHFVKKKATTAARASSSQVRGPARHGTRSRLRRVRYRRLPDPGAGDMAAFDDPVVRRAALAALGRYYGSVVAVDPNTGRILSVVNQKLAFSAGFEPCSTIKPVVALAALKEGLIDRTTQLRVGRRTSMNLVEALAHSNNTFFEELGRRLGFATVSRYARLLGLGESAGWGIAEERPGSFPQTPPPESAGGVAKMCSFGTGIRVTPLQLAAMVSALSNGGYLYYLQYPRTPEQVRQFQPLLKRKIDLGPYTEDLLDGMLAAVEFGTARESFVPEGELVYAKTGTCTDEVQGNHLGWFVSFVSDQNARRPRLVLVVLLSRYGRRVSGPRAAQVGGRIFRTLSERNFFSAQPAGEATGIGYP
jgi:penicillin-binding protein 2